MEGLCHVVLDDTETLDLLRALTMARDISGGACALGVDRAFEVGAFFEGEVFGNDVRLDCGGGTDIDTVGGDVTFEVPIDRDGPRGHRGVNPGSSGCDQIMSFDVDGAFEETIDQHVFACDQFPLDDPCRSAAHGLYFHPSSSFQQAEHGLLLKLLNADWARFNDRPVYKTATAINHRRFSAWN